MKNLTPLLLAALLLPTPALAQAPPPGGPLSQSITVSGAGMDQATQQRIVESLRQARRELKKIKRARKLGCKEARQRAELAAEKADLRIEKALMLLEGAGGTATVQVNVHVPEEPVEPVFVEEPAPAPVVEAPPLMAPHEVASLSGAVGAEAFAKDKLRVLKLGLRGALLRSSDAISLLSHFQFSQGKLQALRLMAPYIEDRHNDFQILQAFTFSADKRKAEQILSH